MKRKNASLLGNVLMGLGLVVMVGGIGTAVFNQLPQLNMPQLLANAAVFGIFIGALFWLIGARISGQEKIADRYWWLRNYDKRCKRQQGPHHS
jgi:hypothetical protein